jgi:hypothetical protein
MEIILDAAYSDGFVKEEPLEDIEVEDDGIVDTLDLDEYRSTFDHCDPGYSSDRYQE